MWDLIVSVPDHCLSFNFDFLTQRLFVFIIEKGNSCLLETYV